MTLKAKPGVHWDDLPFLRDRAVALLQAGPAPVPALAERIFGIRHASPSLAACLVREVLGDDARFRANGSTWLLSDHGSGYGSTPLSEVEFVVVDVEATSGSPRAGGRITEFAAVRLRDGEVVNRFESLINPEQPIPKSVTVLTNITDEMVADAPRFAELADELRAVLEGAVFVAHNARFDWEFLQAEFNRCRKGRLGGRSICTLGLARRLHPELERKNLGALAEYYSISLDGWHRAGPDARATADIFLRFLARLAEQGVERWGCFETYLANRDGNRAEGNEEEADHEAADS
ncbi:MAG: 3'-5' exonuclease [Gemmatimonadota bacterium]|nr:3'-5' exonuclease [Candidatus Palauibacterales bacterium]